MRVLEARASAPLARWRGGEWEVRLEHEPAFAVRAEQHDPWLRIAELERWGIDRAIVALSAPAGVERIPEAVTGWSAAGAALPPELGWWAAAPAGVAVGEQLAIAREAIADGAAGLCLAAPALGGIAEAEAALPLLAEVAGLGVPLFVHPGEARDSVHDPGWWSATTAYVAQMHAAWHSFHAVVRPALPSLRVVFALLAGLAPLHRERAAQRGLDLADAVADQLSFYDTSSYGPDAVRALARVVGSGQLVHGSDHPVAPVPPDPVAAALGSEVALLARSDSPARALGHAWVPA
jgi:predicted TIM-barrel fold metal-dependent hydrolase